MSGDPEGDPEGDPVGVAPGAGEGHSRAAWGGRFWCLDESDVEEQGSPAALSADRSLRYHRDSSVDDRKRVKVDKKNLRIEKRRWKRWAAEALHVPELESDRCSSLRRNASVERSPRKLPVLPPSVTLGGALDVADWIPVRGRRGTRKEGRDSTPATAAPANPDHGLQGYLVLGAGLLW